ncbi:hypothetical protein ES705_32282 [subsurface metagenome]
MAVVCGKCGRTAKATTIGIRVVEMVGTTPENVRPYKLRNADELACPCGETVVWWGFPKSALHFDVSEEPWDELYEMVKDSENYRKIRVWVERDDTFPTRHIDQMITLMGMVQEHRKKVADA